MKKFLTGGGLAAVVAALALAPGASAANPGNLADGNYCGSPPGSSGCSAQWSADVAGSYAGVTSGSYEVDKQVCTTVSGVTTCNWVAVASGGAGPFAGTPGSLAAGGVYQLVITGNGGGAIGSVTGGAGPV
jgi:hypothetical protein